MQNEKDYFNRWNEFVRFQDFEIVFEKVTMH